MLLFKYETNAQTCDYKVGATVSMSLSGQSNGANIASKLVLTNSSGVIQYVSPASVSTLNIPNVALAGTYNAIAVTYDSTSTTPNLTVGSNISSVDSCKKTAPLSIGVCDCNNATGVFNVRQTGQTTIAGQIDDFVLTNGKGVILAISPNTTPTFSNNASGVYNVYGVSYTGTINNLSVGGLIGSVSGNCVNVTQGLGYVVCLPECKPAICAPYSVTKTRKI